jgi:ABC-type dipeptide/oligopeptide/nickel transport system permease subunit
MAEPLPESAAAAAEVRAEVGEAPAREAGLWSDAWRQLRRNPLFLMAVGIVALFALMAAVPVLFTRVDPRDCDLARSLGRPSGAHWFGFDVQGCDYYSRVVHGARVSMTVGLATVAGSGLLAVVGGSLAGYYGGLVDALIGRLTDVWFALPTILGALVILSVLGDKGLPQVTLVLVVMGWPTMLRLMRSSVLATREMDYVAAARALGAGNRRILLRHILPNAIAPVVVYGTIKVGIVIAAEATLSFLGVGLQLPAISWGLMISGAQSRLLSAPHLLLFPGLFLSLTVLAFVLLGDTLRDALDPRLR